MKFLSREFFYSLIKELVWLLLTGMITYAILYPITTKLDYLYVQINAIFIVVSITYFRWSVTFKSLPFLRPAWIRFLLFTFNLTLFIYLMHNEQKLIGKLDNFYTEDLGFPKIIMYDDVKEELFKYLFNEIILFATGSLVMISAFQLRLIISYWQYYKHQATRMMED